MNGHLVVRSWDRPRLFELDPASGRLVRYGSGAGAEATESAGFVKSCIFGSPLMVYQQERSWFLQIGRRRWPLANTELKIEVKKWALGRRIEIDAPGFRTTCRVSDLGFWLGKTLDPTFDRLDHEATDFPLWLAQRRAEARGARYDGA